MMPKDLLARLRAAMLELDGVSEHPSQFAPVTAYWVDGREFLQVEGARLDIRLTRKVIAANRPAYKQDARVELRAGDWLMVRFASAGDLPFALELARLAADANRRKPGEDARPMPDDAGLARRRRFHGGRTEDLG